MNAALRISEVAEQAGVATATVRYYERVGVLPVPVRGANGYRRYDERTVDLLAFIGRLKQLGCTLSEIRELVAIGDGPCRRLQTRLRRIVDTRLTDGQAQIAALTTATVQWQEAAATFDSHRPDGPCDQQCGCRQAPAATSRPTTGAETDALPIVCTLDTDRAQHRVDQWQQLLGPRALAGVVSRRDPIPGGVRLAFTSDLDVAALTSLVVAEHDCCGFFSFAITIDRRGVGLDITAPDEAQPLLVAMFGDR